MTRGAPAPVRRTPVGARLNLPSCRRPEGLGRCGLASGSGGRGLPELGTARPLRTGPIQGDALGRRSLSADPRTDVAPGIPEAAICVQDVDVQCVLQFTLIHAAGCALHRRTSRVIHRIELSMCVCTIERVDSRSRYRNGGPRPEAVQGQRRQVVLGAVRDRIDQCRVEQQSGRPLARRLFEPPQG